ncbi:MmgE/PrpD family protein [Methylobacterium sp. UNC300MFChir4.1]|uniref:MmgE/PrpD family protein n=1 Tax=Methylobacterium sp. UNC300MFChir4.1 TaxID=1502747 RepID=UPI0008C7470D|nr:MmgE/PrpD family protein [Methylobacterium sp. UNC300MFChir4.1]SEP30344.1 MmgE/PrpD family protein [Methylobacterium sp. UNC300MFChir4.1]
MPVLRVRTHHSAEPLEHHRQLAWALAEVAADRAPVPAEAVAIIGERIIDNAARAAAALARGATMSARVQAALHSARPGATVYGLSIHRRVSPDWAAWANGIAVRDARGHDSAVSGGDAQPLDSIGPILAVAQHCDRSGTDLIRGIAAAAEVQTALARGIGANEHGLDTAIHLAPAVAAGIGALLALPVDTIDRAIRAALDVTATRPPPRRDLSWWRASAPAFAGKAAIEAVDRAMRGAPTPAPAYEGEDGIFAWMLRGEAAEYEIRLPARGAPRTAIRDGSPAARTLRRPDDAFRARCADVVPDFEQDRFLNTVHRLPRLSANDLFGLTFSVPPGSLPAPRRVGLFEGRTGTPPLPTRPAPALRLVEPT